MTTHDEAYEITTPTLRKAIDMAEKTFSGASDGTMLTKEVKVMLRAAELIQRAVATDLQIRAFLKNDEACHVNM